MSLPLLLVSITLIFLVFKLYKGIRFKLPPGPYPWPILGNLTHIQPVGCRNFNEWSQIYGPIMSVWYGSDLSIVVLNSKLAKEVLKDNDHQLASRPRRSLTAKVVKDGKDLIWADYGPHYVKVRKVCTMELFSPKSIEALRPIREDEVRAMVESIFKDCTNPEGYGKSLMVRKYLESVAFNNITRLVFGERFENEGVMDQHGLEFKAIVEQEKKVGQSLIITHSIKWLGWISWLKKGEIAKHLAHKDAFTRTIMEKHIQSCNKSGNAYQHFVDTLLTLRERDELSEDTIMGLLGDMITAGMDTIAIVAEWAMAELIKNPRVQQKAQDELDRVIGPNRVMTESDFSSLTYLQCIAKEALRLHPPTPLMLPHLADANVKIGGYDIPKGSHVQVNVWAIGRDPKVWKAPLEFRPERFLEEDVDIKGHDFRLLPFGAGRRMCPAAQLSINLVMSILGHLLHHFHWDPPGGVQLEEIDMFESPGLVTYMRTPLQAVPRIRLSPNLYKREGCVSVCD